MTRPRRIQEIPRSCATCSGGAMYAPAWRFLIFPVGVVTRKCGTPRTPAAFAHFPSTSRRAGRPIDFVMSRQAPVLVHPDDEDGLVAFRADVVGERDVPWKRRAARAAPRSDVDDEAAAGPGAVDGRGGGAGGGSAGGRRGEGEVGKVAGPAEVEDGRDCSEREEGERPGGPAGRRRRRGRDNSGAQLSGRRRDRTHRRES